MSQSETVAETSRTQSGVDSKGRRKRLSLYTRALSVRFSPEELSVVARVQSTLQAAAPNAKQVTLSTAVRTIVRNGGKKLTETSNRQTTVAFNDEVVSALEDVSNGMSDVQKELRAVGRNVNQIAARVNSGGDASDIKEAQAQLKALTEKLDSIGRAVATATSTRW